MVAVTLTSTYSTNGTYTWVAPPGVTTVACAVVGAGGGGAGAGATSGDNGGGGGGGEASYEPQIDVTPGKSYLVIVGAGGAGGTQNTSGIAGTNSQWAGDGTSPAVIGHGGAGGIAGTATAGGVGGLGGTGSTNLVTGRGGNGGDGVPSTNSGGGGGAGGVSATNGFPGGNGSGSTAGAGGGGTFPGGAGGNGTSNAPGNPGVGPGGGGGAPLSTGSQKAGGAGADGEVVIQWVQNDPVTLVNDLVGSVTQFQAPQGASSVTAQAWGAGAGGFNSSSGNQSTALCGGSAFTSAYGSPLSTAVTTFDNRVGRPMAHAARVIYYKEEEYPSASNDSQNAVACANLGIRVWPTFKLSRRAVVAGGSTLTTQQNNFAAAIAYLLSVPNLLIGGIAIGNEPGIFGANGPFGNGSQKNWNLPCPYSTTSNTQAATNFLAYWAAFVGTAVTALAGTGIPIVFKPTVTSQDTSILMFPGAPSSAGGCDGVIIDWYSTEIASGKTPFGAGNMEATCDQAGVGLGLGEWGAAGDGKTTPSLTTWNNYITAMNTGFSNRFSANKKVMDILYFGADSSSGTNYITSASDYKVPGIQTMFDLFNGQNSSGGSGGGGGEFAQETSLPITGLQSYTLVVGNGGAERASGTATTIAGNATTVIAHPGLVGANVSTGGLGGTGSANAVHFDGGAGGVGGGLAGAGGGGGGSAGTAAGGNAGKAGNATTGGAGGAAVTNGGAGGKGGGPSGNGGNGGAPGAGGGARGAKGTSNGVGHDGQITLSNFVTGTDARGNLALGPIGLNGTASVKPAGALALAGLGFAGTGATALFRLIQNAASVNNSGSTITPTCAASTAGADLFAIFTSNGQAAFTTGGSGWSLVQFKATGGASGSIQLWRLPGNQNPGGITSNAWTIPSGGGTGHIMEWAAPAGYISSLDGTPVTISGTTGTTSFPITYGSSTGAGELGVACFNDQFSPAPGSNPWGADPAGWTHQRSQGSGVSDSWISLTNPNLSATTVSVTMTATTSTNQVGYAGILAIFKAVPLNSCSGGIALAGLGFNSSVNSVIPPGTVVGSGGLTLGGLSFMSPDTTQGTWPAVPLPILVEIKINGVWTDITSQVYQRAPIQLQTRGRQDEASTLQPTKCTLILNNTNGDFTVGNPNGQYYPYLVRNTHLRVSVVNAVTPTGANYTGYRFWGEVSAWPLAWTQAGEDVWVTVEAAGVFQRLRQSKAGGSALRRYYRRVVTLAVQGTAPVPGIYPPFIQSNPAAYWPCEDGQLATSFASGIPGGSPLTWGVTVPDLGGAQASSGIALGSDAFAVTNGSSWSGVPGTFNQGGQVFSVPGTFQWICPAGITSISVEAFGGGGGGGNGIGQNGGGGGEWAQDLNVLVTPGNSYTVTVGAGGQGGIGHFTSGNDTTGGGIHGGDSTFAGDNVTVRAHAGRGASNSNPGAGGSGSTNQSHHNGGVGGSSGGGLGGAGGGGSGGPTGTGHAGQSQNSDIGGAGGTAVGDGGPGGNGGLGHGAHSTDADATAGHTPSIGPGGGGGAGGFNNQSGRTGYGKPGGNGQNGQVSITFGVNFVPAPPANAMRFLLLAPATGAVNNAQLAQFTTNGTPGIVNLLYTTPNSGSLQVIIKSAGGTTLFTGNVLAVGCNGVPMIISVELTQTGTNTITVNLKAVAGNATTLAGQTKGTMTGTLGSFTAMSINNGSTLDTGCGIGHVIGQYVIDPLLNISPALAGYNGEHASDRIERLCDEENIPAFIIGNSSDSAQMGPQLNELVSDLMQECETADLGLIYEPRDNFGVGYITRVALQNQNYDALTDYSLAQLAPPMAPTNDELLVRNDVIAQRESGSSYEGIATTGNLSILDPPNGVGTYAFNVNVNLFNDNQLPAYVTWVLTLGTVDEYRYPQITYDMRRAAVNADVFAAIASLDIGSLLGIQNTPPWLPPGTINQLIFGYKETINAFEWTIIFNGVPADPYSAAPGTSLPTW